MKSSIYAGKVSDIRDWLLCETHVQLTNPVCYRPGSCRVCSWGCSLQWGLKNPSSWRWMFYYIVSIFLLFSHQGCDCPVIQEIWRFNATWSDRSFRLDLIESHLRPTTISQKVILTQHNTMQRNATQHNTTQCNTMQCNTTQHNTTPGGSSVGASSKYM